MFFDDQEAAAFQLAADHARASGMDPGDAICWAIDHAHEFVGEVTPGDVERYMVESREADAAWEAGQQPLRDQFHQWLRSQGCTQVVTDDTLICFWWLVATSQSDRLDAEQAEWLRAELAKLGAKPPSFFSRPLGSERPAG